MRLDPALLAEVRFAALSAADLGALLCLWSAAWQSGGTLPRDDCVLAALSRLGEGWACSRLWASLPLFFRREADHLVAVDLADQLAKKESISAKRSRAGKASGASRSTRVQHLPNTCSTRVEHVTEPARKRVRKPRKSKELDQPSRKDNDGPGAAQCAPPMRDTSKEVKESLEELSHPPGGSGGVDLFGNPLEPSRPRPAPRGPSPEQGVVDGIVAYFVEKTQNVHPPTDAARRGVRGWMKKGYTREQLCACVDNYLAWCEALGRDGQFRKSPDKFFGVEDGGFFKGYLQPVALPASKNPAAPARAGFAAGDVGGGSRIRRETRSYDHVKIIRIGTPAPGGAPDLPAPPGGSPPGGQHRALAEGGDQPADAR